MSIRDRIWGTGAKATQEEVVELTNQFYVTLRAYFIQIKKDGEEAVRNKEAYNRIKALLEPEEDKHAIQNWTNAYEVEQLLVHLFDDETVASELGVRILEARSILSPELSAMYATHLHDIDNPPAGSQAANATPAPARRRTLLARLINDLQWRYIVNEATRRYSKLITRRTATLSVIALLSFVGAIIVIATRPLTFHYGDLHMLWLAGLAGMWGATFSMLATLQKRLGDSKFDDLKLMKAGSVLLSRAAIGAGAACILFFFLLSGLLGGSAFPALARPRGTDATTPAATQSTAPDSGPTPSTSTPTPQPGPDGTLQQEPSTPVSPASVGAETSGNTPVNRARSSAMPLVDPTDLALLIVWCFIAGFSEQLIPGLLATTEARAGSQGPSTTDRFRPTTGTTQVAPPTAPQTTAASGQTPATQPPPPDSGTQEETKTSEG